MLLRSHPAIAALAAAFVALAAPPGQASVLHLVAVHRGTAGGATRLDGPRGLAISPEGAHLYVASANDSAVTTFTRNATSGLLTVRNVRRNRTAGISGLGGACAVVISPDGAHVYVAGRTDAAIAVFRRDPATGMLVFITAIRDETGRLGLRGLTSLSLTDDGGTLYAAGTEADAVATFRRDPTTGDLAFVGTLQNSTTPAGLAHVRSVLPAPGGARVYTAASGDDTLATFDRDPGTGVLTFATALRDGRNGIDGLDGVRALALGPEALQLYAVASADEALTIFRRDPGTGALALLQVVRDDAGGVDGLNGAQAAAVSPDGRLVYVVSNVDEALAAFDRDPTTGVLAFREVHRHVPTARDGLGGAHALAASPDDRHLYVAGFTDDAVAVFRVGEGTPSCVSDDACNAWTWQETAGECIARVRPDDSPCDDGDPSTFDDVCTAGVCAGALPPDQDLCPLLDICPGTTVDSGSDDDPEGPGSFNPCSGAGGACLHGGGQPQTDCLLEFDPGPFSFAPSERRGLQALHCTDGDPTCDADGVDNGSCTFAVRLCFGSSDPDLPRCRVSGVRSIAVGQGHGRRGASAGDRATTAAIERAVLDVGLQLRRDGRMVGGAATSVRRNVCTRSVAVSVPRSTAGGSPPTLRLRARSSDKRTDVDHLQFDCHS